MRLPDVMENPHLVQTEYAFESALWFFRANKLFTICDQGVDDETIKVVTKRVNGGTHGLKDREEQTKRFTSGLPRPSHWFNYLRRNLSNLAVTFCGFNSVINCVHFC